MSNQISPNSGGNRQYPYVYEIVDDPLLATAPMRIVLVTRHGKSYLSRGDARRLADTLNQLADNIERQDP